VGTSLDLFEDAANGDDLPSDGLHWPRVRDWLHAHPDPLTQDRALLEELGLRATGRNVVDFGTAALGRVEARLEAVVERETDARRRIETIARANFAAQTQTHVAALDLMEATGHSDLARRLDGVAQARFGVAGAAVALEKPGAIPFGWRALDPGGVDRLMGEDGLHWLGPRIEGLSLFGAVEDTIQSIALIRMAPHIGPDGAARHALCAFGSTEADGFTPAMGCELAAFIARVVERMAERWPVAG
jgi:hypothetical protein